MERWIGIARGWVDVGLEIARGWVDKANLYLDQLGVPGGDWRLIGAAAVVLMLLWLLVRRRGGGAGRAARGKGGSGGRVGGGGKGARAALEARDHQLEADGVKQWDRPGRLIAGHPGLSELPEPLLWELTSRLHDPRGVIDFIDLAERHGLLRRELPAIAQGQGAAGAMPAIAEILTELAARKPADAETALLLAARLDPDDPRPALALANCYYAAQRFQPAIISFERVISLCRKLQDTSEGGAAVARRYGDLSAMVSKSMELYQDCLSQVDHQTA